MQRTPLAATKRIAESLVLPSLALAILAYWPASRIDYPWWWLAPLAIALRYGIVYGTGSAVWLVLGAVGVHAWDAALPLPTAAELVGGFIATSLAGLYASHAQHRISEDNARLDYLEQRLESLTRVFYVTRLSHARLEESLITKPDDLRSALVAVAEGIAPQTGAQTLPAEPLQYMLQLLAYYGRVEQAGVFAVHANRPAAHAVTTLGPDFTLSADDALVRSVIEQAEPAYYSVDQILADQTSAYRMVLPMVAADGTLMALVVVPELPLLAITEENMLTLAAMVAYVADALRAASLTAPILQRQPACPRAFALEWRRLGHLAQGARVRSSWVRLSRAEGADARVLALLESMRRGLDQYWQQTDRHGSEQLLVLLPLAGEGAVRGFVQRIDEACREHLGGALNALGWRVSQGLVRRGNADELDQVLQTEPARA